MPGTVDPTTLLDAPLGDLMAEAARLRDSAHGARITFSPKVFIPLTMLCRDRCGYCTFAEAPCAPRRSLPLAIDEVVDIARRGAALGCHEALFTLGEAPEDRYPVAAEWLAAHGYSSTVDYLVARARPSSRRPGLLPHANAGALSQPELERLRPSVAVAGNDDRDARGSPRGTGRPARWCAGQDPRAPAGHARSRGTRRDPVHHRHPRRDRRDTAPSGSTRSSRSARRTSATGTCKR